MVKVTQKQASGGQEINPLDPRLVTMTGLWPVMVTIKVCLANFRRIASGGEVSHLESRLHMRFTPRTSGQITDAFDLVS